MKAPAAGMYIVPPMGREKRPGLAVITHRGGGWYQVICCNNAKKCKAGECKHIASLYTKSGRQIKPVPRSTDA